MFGMSSTPFVPQVRPHPELSRIPQRPVSGSVPDTRGRAVADGRA